MIDGRVRSGGVLDVRERPGAGRGVPGGVGLAGAQACSSRSAITGVATDQSPLPSAVVVAAGLPVHTVPTKTATAAFGSAVPSTSGAPTFDGDAGSVPVIVGALGASSSRTYVTLTVEQGETLPTASVAVALNVVVWPLRTVVDVRPGSAKLAAGPGAGDRAGARRLLVERHDRARLRGAADVRGRIVAGGGRHGRGERRRGRGRPSRACRQAGSEQSLTLPAPSVWRALKVVVWFAGTVVSKSTWPPPGTVSESTAGAGAVRGAEQRERRARLPGHRDLRRRVGPRRRGRRRAHDDRARRGRSSPRRRRAAPSRRRCCRPRRSRSRGSSSRRPAPRSSGSRSRRCRRPRRSLRPCRRTRRRCRCGPSSRARRCR